MVLDKSLLTDEDLIVLQAIENHYRTEVEFFDCLRPIGSISEYQDCIIPAYWVFRLKGQIGQGFCRKYSDKSEIYLYPQQPSQHIY